MASDFGDSLVDIWKLRKRGAKDQERHKELVKKAIKENGKELITEYNIIKSNGTDKIKVPIRFLDQYQFKYGKIKNDQGVGQGQDVKPGSKYRKGNMQPGSDPANGKAGNEAGEDIYQADVTIDEFVDILLEELNLPWMTPKEDSKFEVVKEEFVTITKKGLFSNLDKKRTLLENIKRNAAKGNPQVGGFANEDLRFKNSEEKKEYHSNAAVYMLLDRSGSMFGEKTDIAKTFFFWMVQFLKKRYKNIELVFVAHDSVAKIVTEEQFFSIAPSGGTVCSCALELALETMQARHPPERYNNYVMHFSDGDNFGNDNQIYMDLVKEALPLCRAIGYGEIMLDDGSFQWMTDEQRLSTILDRGIKRTRFVSLKISSREEVFEALKMFFNIDKIAAKETR
jgi:sporulation protein YhbH